MIETSFHNWQTHQPADDARYDRCSPNLIEIGRELGKRWAMTDVGCYVERDIRAGQSPSSHSHGAARDINYKTAGRPAALNEIIPFLIDNSAELHVQAIHDYFGSRIWRAGRTQNPADAYSTWWRAQTKNASTGMGQAWAVYFHIETTETGWIDSRPIPGRLAITVPPPAPPSGALVFTRTIKKGDTGADVAFIQTVIRAPGSPSGNKVIVVDGNFGSQTETSVKNIQAFTGLTADGIVGPQTQAKFMQLANS